MQTLAIQDLNIEIARNRGTLRVREDFNKRLGVPFWAIEDEHGLIEVCLSEAEAYSRTGYVPD